MTPIRVKILGVGCARCRELEREVRAVVRERGLAVEVVRVEDFFEIMRYRLLATPGLVVNEQVVCAGRMPSRAEIVAWLTGGNE